MGTTYCFMSVEKTISIALAGEFQYAAIVRRLGMRASGGRAPGLLKSEGSSSRTLHQATSINYVRQSRLAHDCATTL